MDVPPSELNAEYERRPDLGGAAYLWATRRAGRGVSPSRAHSSFLMGFLVRINETCQVGPWAACHHSLRTARWTISTNA